MPFSLSNDNLVSSEPTMSSPTVKAPVPSIFETELSPQTTNVPSFVTVFLIEEFVIKSVPSTVFWTLPLKVELIMSVFFEFTRSVSLLTKVVFSICNSPLFVRAVVKFLNSLTPRISTV